MKSLFMGLTLLCVVFAQSAFAKEFELSARVKSAFEHQFTQAQEVKWSKIDNLYKAIFNLDGQEASAFYNESGHLIAATRSVTVSQLPLSLQTSLRARVKPETTIAEIFELNNDDGITYFASLKTGTKTTVLQSASGDWQTYLKTKN